MGFEPLREEEGSFFKDNKVAVGSGRVTSFNATGGKTQPTIEKDYLEDTGVGKGTDQRDPALNTNLPNSLNVS